MGDQFAETFAVFHRPTVSSGPVLLRGNLYRYTAFASGSFGKPHRRYLGVAKHSVGNEAFIYSPHRTFTLSFRNKQVVPESSDLSIREVFELVRVG